MPQRDPQGRKTRSLEEVKDTPRSRPRSLWRTAKEEVVEEKPHLNRAAYWKVEPQPAPKPPLRERLQFLGSAWKKWITEFVKHIFKGRAPLPAYAAGQTGRYRLPDRVRIALASDWGTGTESAYAVGAQIIRRKPDITIHLGDVYYSGANPEFDDYFNKEECWPRGSRSTPGPNGEAAGTYVLNANHEMYSGGEGYFAALRRLQQTTSYFCLENSSWRIVAIDTGYHCDRGLKLAFGKLIGRHDSTQLDKNMIAWLEQTVLNDPRPVILLSHHQWISAFDARVYPKLGKQLTPFLPAVHLWIWGHEHALAGYRACKPDGKTIVRGRCVGHGGMPVELSETLGGWSRDGNCPDDVVFSDQRFPGLIVNNVKIGLCGFALMDLDGPGLVLTYVDENGQELLRESWTIAGGAIRGSAEVLTSDPGFVLHRDISELTAPAGSS